jgi:hypothetical protein
MVNISSAMAGQFAEAATQMSQRIARLGPNPLRMAKTRGEQNIDGSEKVEADL